MSNMNKIAKYCICISLAFSSQVFAIAANNKTVSSVGVNDSTGNGYFRVVENLGSTCTYGVIFFQGKAFLSTILLAKSLKNRIAILNYTIDASQNCNLVSLEME